MQCKMFLLNMTSKETVHILLQTWQHQHSKSYRYAAKEELETKSVKCDKSKTKLLKKQRSESRQQKIKSAETAIESVNYIKRASTNKS